MALHVETSIDIDAAPEAVWAVLSDLPSYPRWNPFIREASGTLAAGERLDLTMQPEGGRAMRFRPTVLEAQPGRELRWLGRLVAPGVFDGEHRFAIEPTAGAAGSSRRSASPASSSRCWRRGFASAPCRPSSR